MPSSRVLGWFPDVASALTFAGLCAPQHDITQSTRFFRGPGRSALWVEVDLPLRQIGHLVALAGGTLLAVRDNRVIRVGGHGQTPTWIPEHLSELEPGEIDLVSLLDDCPSAPVDEPTARELVLLAPGSLVRWVLRRSYDAGSAWVAPATWRRVRHNGTAEGICLRLSVRRPADAGFLYDLAELPGVLAARPADGTEDLWSDVRYRFPTVLNGLRSWIPPGGRWLLSDHLWEFTLTASARDASDLLDPPRSRPDRVASLPTSPLAGLPRTQVKIAPSAGAEARIDAVLVTDEQLTALRRCLETTPTDHAARLIVGHGLHLLLGGGSDDLGQIPLGTPVRHLGPGGLYLESGCILRPAVPRTARPGLFQLRDDRIVVATREGILRLDRRNAVPAWTLWLGSPPAVEDELSPAGLHLLRNLEEIGHQPPAPEPDAAPPAAERADLLERAADLLELGQFAAAAEQYEQAGEHRRAAILYRRAAAEP